MLALIYTTTLPLLVAPELIAGVLTLGLLSLPRYLVWRDKCFKKDSSIHRFRLRKCMELTSRNCVKNGKRLVKSLNGLVKPSCRLVVTDFRLVPTVHGSVRFAQRISPELPTDSSSKKTDSWIHASDSC